MKKWMFIVLGIVCVIGAILLAWPKVNMKKVNDIEAKFIYGDVNSVNNMEPEDVETIKNLFQGSRLYWEYLYCGFSEEVSIKTDCGQTFYIARDRCPTIFWKEKNMYFDLTQEERSILEDLLEKYGFYFPCV